MKGTINSYKHYVFRHARTAICSLFELVYTPHNSERNNLPVEVNLPRKSAPGKEQVWAIPVPTASLSFSYIEGKELPLLVYAEFYKRLKATVKDFKGETPWIFHLVELDEYHDNPSYIILADPNLAAPPRPCDIRYRPDEKLLPYGTETQVPTWSGILEVEEGLFS